MRIITIIILLISTSIVAQETTDSLPKIIVLATGGTIAGQGDSSSRAAYEAGKIPVDQLLGEIPDIKKVANITGEQISSVGSQDMTIEIWRKLDNRINEIFKNNEADGVVITHGTDTQEETAYFLNLSLRYKNPVVITGSMRSSTAISADGPKNLFDAIIVAANKKSNGKGVLTVFNEYIFSGRDITKFNSTNVDAFRALNSGPIGNVYDARVIYYQNTIRTKDTSIFNITDIEKLPQVEIVYMYADAPADMIEYWTKKKVDGLVIAGVGNGNLNKAFIEALDKAVKKGIKVCRASRVPKGRVLLEGEFDDELHQTIVSDDLNPQKARILLMLGLTQSQGKDQLQSYFFEY